MREGEIKGAKRRDEKGEMRWKEGGEDGGEIEGEREKREGGRKEEGGRERLREGEVLREGLRKGG